METDLTFQRTARPTQQSVGGAFDTGQNNFDLMRLVAALTVLWSHSYPLSGHGVEPIWLYSGGLWSGGDLAVATFFVASGFLVTRSVERNDLTAYLSARVLRIMPALAVVILIQTLLVGPIVTALSARDYFSSGMFIQLFRELSVFNMTFRLPGVFLGNPYSAVVNGSLWTLPGECSFYLVLPFLFLLGILRPIRIIFVFAAIVAVFLIVTIQGSVAPNVGGMAFKDVPSYFALTWALYFAAGGVLWVHRYDVPLSGGLAAACLILIYATAGSLSGPWLFHLAFPYLVIYVAFAKPVASRWGERFGDLSYGTYVYAFLIQQIIVHEWRGPIGPSELTLIALPITLVCASLSWHFIEKPSLGVKRRIERMHAMAGAR
jgi:peptidoglycan/LPS O-acetylase OafA/YrhL